MGRSAPVTLGRFTFNSKTAAKDALRSIRDAVADRQPIHDEDAVDILLGVLAAHPQAAQKVGAGIAGFFAARSPDYPTRCFYLRRVDGSETDFSWNEAITPTLPITRLRMACRNATMDQKMEFRDREWPADEGGERMCPITGIPFTRETAHVDHQTPVTFMRLVDDWLSAAGLEIGDVPIDHVGDLRSVDTFADVRQANSWREYHRQYAVLRLVSAEGNLRQGARLLGL
jgi:hypothetical protein